jgi:hypothetical protein
MSRRNRAIKRFWKSVFQLFIIYTIVIPAAFYILNQDSFLKLAQENISLFLLEMCGISLGISFIISLWSKRDPELREW